jgi:cytochrome c-type biogenesis protein CcmE
MKPRAKFLIGGAPVLSVSGFLMASSIRATAVYYLTPSELNADPGFRDAGVKVGARVVPGLIDRLPGGREYSFRAKCASRYENAPAKYQETPGYKAGAKRA